MKFSRELQKQDFSCVKFYGLDFTPVTGVADPESATEQDLTLLTKSSYIARSNSSSSRVVLINEQILPRINKLDQNKCYILSKYPRLFLASLLERFVKLENNSIISKTSHVHKTASIGSNVSIGDNSVIHANVTICDNVTIGSNVIIHPGAVIGSDGFSNELVDNKWVKIKHFAGVIVEDNVEIGANTTIDQGFYYPTLIRNNARLDNLIQVGHNVEIGSNTAIASQCGIAGSTVIGNNCLIGGKVGIGGHLSICDRVIVAATSAVSRSITEPGMYSSVVPAQKSSLWNKVYVKLVRNIKKEEV